MGSGAQPPQMLADGEVVMSTAYNGRIFNAQVLEKQPFVIVLDGQVLDHGILGIVAGTPKLEAARKFLTFATRTESLAAIGRYIAYSPARRSGTAHDYNPSRNRCGHAAAYAEQSRKRRRALRKRLGVVERSRRRDE